MNLADSSFDRMARQAWRNKGGSNLFALSLANDMVREFLRLAAEEARAGKRVHLPSIGALVVRERKARTLKGPPGSKQAGQDMKVPPTWRLYLRPTKGNRGALRSGEGGT